MAEKLSPLLLFRAPHPGSGKPAPVQFNNLTATISGYRDVRFLVKYIF